MEEKKKVKGMVEPPSNSLTQTDRDYYNMVRTEDGKSGFFLDKKLKNLWYDNFGCGVSTSWE